MKVNKTFQFSFFLVSAILFVSSSLYAQGESTLPMEDLYAKTKGQEQVVGKQFEALVKEGVLANDLYTQMERYAERVDPNILSPESSRVFKDFIVKNPHVISAKTIADYEKIEKFLNNYDYLLKLRSVFIAKYHHAQFHELMGHAFEVAMENDRQFSKKFRADYKKLQEYYDKMLIEFEADLSKTPTRLDGIERRDRWRRTQGQHNWTPFYFATMESLLNEMEAIFTNKPLWKVKLNKFRQNMIAMFRTMWLWIKNATVLKGFLAETTRLGKGTVWKSFRRVLDANLAAKGSKAKVIHEHELPEVIKENGKEVVRYKDRLGRYKVADIVFVTPNHPSPNVIAFAQTHLMEKYGAERSVAVTSAFDTIEQVPGMKEINFKMFVANSRDFLYVRDQGLDLPSRHNYLTKGIQQRVEAGRKFFFLYPQGDGVHGHDGDINRYATTVAEFLPLLAQKMGLRIAIIPVNMSSYEHTMNDIHARHKAFGKDYVVDVAAPISQEAFNLMSQLRRSNHLKTNNQTVVFRLLQLYWLQNRFERFGGDFKDGIISVEELIDLNEQVLFNANSNCGRMSNKLMRKMVSK